MNKKTFELEYKKMCETKSSATAFAREAVQDIITPRRTKAVTTSMIMSK